MLQGCVCAAELVLGRICLLWGAVRVVGVTSVKLQDRQLIPTETVFHGIVPGKSAKPIGKIYLEVAFGTMENYRSEIMPFEVVDLKSPYHALFGRPAYFKFMARPCYVYLKLKMPGPAGAPVTDNSEQLNKDVNGESQHSNFSSKT